MATKSSANSAGAARVVAVDLGPRFVRVAEVEQAGGEAHMVRRGSATLPPNCWNDFSANREGIAAAIREAMSSAGIAARAVVACIPRRLVTVRFARLPHAPAEQLRGMIEFEAQQYILFPLNEVVLDYDVQTRIGNGIAAGADDMDPVLLVAARRALISDILAIFDRLGIELQRLSVSALALSEHARSSLEPTALIALEAGSLDVSIVADGQLLFTRSSAIEISGIDPQVAVRRLSDEVARSFTAYQNEFRQKPVSTVYLCGGETASPSMDWTEQVLTEVLEKPVQRLHSRLLPAADVDSRNYAIAAGMALEAFRDRLADINLVPNERAERKVLAQKRRNQVLLGLAGAAAAAFGGFYLFNAIQDQDKRQRQQVVANREMEDAEKAAKPIQAQHDRVASLGRILEQSLDRAHPAVDVLVVLNHTLPKSAEIWLTQMSFDRSGLMTLRGEAKTSRAVTDMLLNLQSSGAFTDVRLSYLADAQDTTAPASDAPATPKTAVVPPLPGLAPPTANAAAAPAGAASTPASASQQTAPAGAPAGGRVFTPGGNFTMPNMPQGGFPGFNGRGFPGFNRGGAPGFNPGGAPGFNPGGAPGFNPGGAPTQQPAAPSAAPAGVPSGRNSSRTGSLVQVKLQQGADVQITTLAAPAPVAPQGATIIVPAQGAPPSVSIAQPQGGQVVITPDMAAAGGPNGAGRRFNRRNGFGAGFAGATGMPNGAPAGGMAPGAMNANPAVPGSPNTAGQRPGQAPGSAPAVGTVIASVAPTSTPKSAGSERKATKSADKPMLTGFVITCRLNRNAKLHLPGIESPAERHKDNRGATAPSGAASDSGSNDDTGDEE